MAGRLLIKKREREAGINRQMDRLRPTGCHFIIEPMSRISVRQRSAAEVRLCDHPDCAAAGDYRAPRSPRDLGHHFWFCLEHVRAYNASWNYFEGMSQDEIERYQQSSVTWHRPTWRFGDDPSHFKAPIYDELGILESHAAAGRAQGRAEDDERRPDGRSLAPEERHALALLNLAADTTLDDIKARYKSLAKKYHPDANGGDREAEDRLKEVNQAYAHLLTCGYC